MLKYNLRLLLWVPENFDLQIRIEYFQQIK